MTTILIALIIASYLLGSLPLSYLVAKRRGIDLSKQGTLQVGAGNLWRMTSRKLGLMVGLFDFIKGLIMVVIAHLVGLDAGQQLLVGLAAITGHNWPIFLRFHGGRGIATLVGIVFILPVLNDISPWPSIIAVGAVVFVTIIFRTSAVPVLLGAASLPLTSWLFEAPESVVFTYLAIFLIVVIKRLTAQPSREKRQISIGHLLLNRLLFDRDIADRNAWMRGKKAARKETQHEREQRA